MRINNKYAYIRLMKNRLNLTVDDVLMKRAKLYAAKHQTSVSQLVEQYLKKLTRPSSNENVIQLVERLPKTTVEKNTNLKEAYYEDQQKKYGF